MYVVHTSSLEVIPGWLLLAREAEPLFGPMVDDTAFIDGLKRAIHDGKAFDIRDEDCNSQCSLRGGIVISPQTNEILWFAVTQESRGKGIGKALLSEAIKHLKPDEPITVTTFDESIKAGRPARALYHQFGFRDVDKGEPNPARIPTVLMMRMNPMG